MRGDDLALAAQGKVVTPLEQACDGRAVLVLDLRSVASKPFHADAGGENADGQQWNELAPADGPAHLNGAAEDLGAEPSPFPRAASASSACSIVRRRDHRQQTAAIIVANRKRPASAVAAVSGSYHWDSQMKAITRTK